MCSEQMKSLEKNHAEFEKLKAVAVGISVDSVPCKNAWAKSLGIVKTRLLADFWPHGDVAKLYGIFRENDGFSERANIIINEQHRVEFVRIYPIAELPDIKLILKILKG